MIYFRNSFAVRFGSRFSTMAILKVRDMFMANFGLCLYRATLMLCLGLEWDVYGLLRTTDIFILSFISFELSVWILLGIYFVLGIGIQLGFWLSLVLGKFSTLALNSKLTFWFGVTANGMFNFDLITTDILMVRVCLSLCLKQSCEMCSWLGIGIHLVKSYRVKILYMVNASDRFNIIFRSWVRTSGIFSARDMFNANLMYIKLMLRS